jgi:hypothetical protein
MTIDRALRPGRFSETLKKQGDKKVCVFTPTIGTNLLRSGAMSRI